MLLIPKNKPIRCNKHLAFVRRLPCAVTGGQMGIEAAHIRHGLAGGMGMKPSDSRVLPLTYLEHRKQHKIGEVEYWGSKLDLAKWTALALWNNTGDRDECIRLLARFRNENI